MEKAGVIRAVPAEFIKCLNAMHLAPKDAGKDLGMSCEALLRRCNEQCRKYGLMDYWELTDDDEETIEPDPTMQSTDDEPKTPPKKWRVCQAFHAINVVTQILVVTSHNTLDRADSSRAVHVTTRTRHRLPAAPGHLGPAPRAWNLSPRSVALYGP